MSPDGRREADTQHTHTSRPGPPSIREAFVPKRMNEPEAQRRARPATGPRAAWPNKGARAHLVTPLEHVLVPVLDGVVDVQELEDAVPPHVVGVALGLFPAQRRALGQQPHGRVLLPAAPPPRGRPRAARRASRPFPLRLGPRRVGDSPGRGPSPPPGLALPRRPCGPGRRGSAPLGAAGVVHGLPTCDPKLRRHRACPVPRLPLRAPRSGFYRLRAGAGTEAAGARGRGLVTGAGLRPSAGGLAISELRTEKS